MVFLLPNATSNLQTLDQGIIKVLKQKYRKKLVQRYLCDMECTNSTKMDIFDSMNYIDASWDEIKPNVKRNCFRKAEFDMWNDLEEADSSSLEDKDFQTMQNFPVYAMAVVNAKEEDSEQEKNGQVEDDEPTPTVIAGLQHLSELRKVLTSLEHAVEILSYAKKFIIFLLQCMSKTSNKRK